MPDFPYTSLCKLGMVAASRTASEKVYELRKLFGVSSLHNLHDVEKYNPAFRLSNKNAVSKEAIVSLHNKRSVFIEGKVIDKAHEQQEKEADDFAGNALIPNNKYSEFTSEQKFSHAYIKNFSEQIGIHPGIITGRLQHDWFLNYTQNMCRVRYKWK